MDSEPIKKEYIVGLTAGALIILIAFVFFAVRPMLISSASLVKEIDEKSGQIEKAQVTLKQEGDIKEAIREVEDRLAYYKEQLPEERKTAWLLEELNRIAKKTGIQFVSVTPLPPRRYALAGGGSYFEIPMRIRLRCGYHHLGKFINEVENSSRFMKVKDLQVSSSGKNILRHEVTFAISSFVFEFKDKESK